MLGMLAYCARPGDASMDTSRVSCVSHPLLILIAITVANRLLYYPTAVYIYPIAVVSSAAAAAVFGLLPVPILQLLPPM